MRLIDLRPLLITLSDISMEWDGKKVLSNVSLDIARGDFLAVTGPNGGGKSTLLRIMLKLLKPTAGEVRYLRPDGQPVSRLHIGYLPQKNMIDSRFPITVREVIASGLANKKGLSHDAVQSRVDEMLKLVQLESHGRAAIGALSGGQLQRALMGRALIGEPEVLVMDEPLSYLDKHFEQNTYNILEELAGKTTIILVSHEMTQIARIATRHLIVDHSVHECTAACHYIPTPCE